MPTAATASSTDISILPGFSTTLASASSGVSNPFGLWFANDNTLYVGDEGDGKTNYGGLQKWVKTNGTWSLKYTLTNGLALGTEYDVNGYKAATAGLRNIAGKVNGDGTVSIYGITSTISGATDQGADPNKLVGITDSLAALALPTGETFTTLEAAGYGEVLRGVAVTPTPLPAAVWLLGSGLMGLLGIRRRTGK